MSRNIITIQTTQSFDYTFTLTDKQHNKLKDLLKTGGRKVIQNEYIEVNLELNALSVFKSKEFTGPCYVIDLDVALHYI